MRKKDRTTFFRNVDLKRKWFLFDASGKILGRFASEVSKVLRGKHKPEFTPFCDFGDGVIIINADKIRVTGSKEAQKIYYSYTGHTGGLREIPYRIMQARKPGKVIWLAVKGMMPKTRLAKAQLKHLRIFAGREHGMRAQQTIQVNI